jgi:beta-glucuronidase
VRRRYREHDLRVVTDLSGVWDFAFLGEVDPETIAVGDIPFDTPLGMNTAAVPGCFDATPAYAGQRGLVAYRRSIVLADTTPHRLYLAGVHHWCRVFVDGEPLRDHAGGFTRFPADLRGHMPGVAELVILVDNRFDFLRSPLHLEYFDWYHFGGIAGGAELHRLGELWIDSVQVTTLSISPPTLQIKVAYSGVGTPEGTGLEISLGERPLISETLSLDQPEGVIERTIEIRDAALWSPEDPNLHLVHVRLGSDDLRTRIGIRSVEVRGQEILINGTPVRLLGFNRHAAHPQFGHALPEMVQLSDVQQLRDLGANFVRGSHYPQDASFLDLCDEAGLCVWSEAIGWQHTALHLTDAHFTAAQVVHIDEMVAADYNHASIIMWGVLNESHSHDPACRSAYAELLGRLRQLDQTRPVLYASNHPFEDLCFDLVDIIAVNCYPGWYGSEIALIPEELDRIVAHVDGPQGQSGKPLIISEIGAGAIYGWRDQNGARWTEQYQVELLDKVINHLFVDRERFAGLAIWQFCDIRASQAVQKILGRPRGFNNKGVVDEYRRPKMAYETVRRAFRALTEPKL